jgi:hypothetical protein
MSGVLRTALDFYTRTRLQRWLLAIGSLILVAERVAELHACPCRNPSPWLYLTGGLAGLAIIAALMLAVVSASYFNQISALRTVSLIPHSRLKLAIGMFLAQLIAGTLVTVLVMFVGHAESIPPLAWGSPRGTCEILFGTALLVAVLLQAIAGPSSIVRLSVGLLVPIAILGLRVELFVEPVILGLPAADFLALAGLLAWLLFATWYIRAWRSVATPAGSIDPIYPIKVSRQAAIDALLLGEPSLTRACRGQVIMWMIYNVGVVVTLAAMKLLLARHAFPANYSMAIIILLVAPVVAVNTFASSLARGSRRVWLCSGESRDALHTNAVRLAWRSVALLGLPLWGLALLEIIVLPHKYFDMRLPLTTSLTLTPCALYLGLLHFQRRPVLSVLALLLVALGIMFASLVVESPQGQQFLWLAPVVLIAIACSLRAFAQGRWHGIDWLRFRAERDISPFAARRA